LTVKSWHSFAHFQPTTIGVFTSSAQSGQPPAPGDLVLVVLWNNGQNNGAPNPYTAPDNSWTLDDSSTTDANIHYATYQVFSHIAVAGEAYPYVFTPEAPDRTQVYIGADIANASGVEQAGHTPNTTDMTTYATPTLTPQNPNDMAITFQLTYNQPETWTNDPSWTVGLAASTLWSGESLTRMLSSPSPVSETSTLSTADNGWSALVLVKP
jgi:hypothetical protein